MIDAAPVQQTDPLGYFTFNKEWNVWEQMSAKYKNASDATPLYLHPPSAELARLRAENERLRADAARLDSGVIAIDAEPGLFANPLTSQVIFKGDLRKYIDEAIEQDTPEWRAKYCVP